ncbi:PX domain-containing protein kinase-like protein [Lycorma delicatula]|uniref:PX domain-containing protein kinase-like protein n=1 Tax=Lycorma delicatula TaxID=130591 RepID=UPI003F519BB2
MAVFENNARRKVCLDDTIELRCLIVNTQYIRGHTEYVIKVCKGCGNDKCWKVYKRYNDFVALHHALQASSLNLPLPPKKYINNLDREFIAERQAGLQKYLNIVLMNPILACSLPVKKFLDPENYTIPFQELALQYVSIALRGDLDFDVVKSIPDIGWRIRKHYFQVKKKNVSNSSNMKDEYILSWCEYGPDKYVSDKDMHALFKSLSTLQHRNISEIESCGSVESGAYVIRKLKPEGTLRDLICHAKPKLPFLKKYANPKQCSALPTQKVIFYCSQILHVLVFLKDKGILYGNLHTGNISIENDIVKLLDIENGILGVPSYYRPFFMQHRKISTLEAVDVYCFGHVLYEMLFGRPLQVPVCDNYLPDSCPTELRTVLEGILSPNACRSGLPTLESLISMPVFSSIHYSLPERPHIKLSTHVKEILKESCNKFVARMEDEQKKIRHQKRLVKMQQVLSGEGDQKIERKKNKAKTVEKKISADQTSQINGHDTNNYGLTNNGISPERSDSPNSTSTATSAGTLTPPAVVPPPPIAPSFTLSSPVETAVDQEGAVVDDKRSALLGSICNFDKSTLRRTKKTS